MPNRWRSVSSSFPLSELMLPLLSLRPPGGVTPAFPNDCLLSPSPVPGSSPAFPSEDLLSPSRGPGEPASSWPTPRLSPKDGPAPGDAPRLASRSGSGGLELVEPMDPTELVEVRLSFLATRGEEEPPVRDGMVTSGGAVVEGIVAIVEGKFFGEEREMDTTLSP
ncbi:hypothetical protein EYF80_005085 [Liparis tanakae]|uniref:Uncharacterized protein n=1 Tax=Liparis tanakae TaxID=230148 RepID=A0A4Z2J383_9TELE|nr:hypothetical protein EYF80_005085 [Liparis tanakae]